GIAELLHAAIGCHTRIGKRSEFLEFQTAIHLDQIASLDWQELSESTIRSKTRPTHVGADMSIANQAMTACSIAPSGCDHDMAALPKPRRLVHAPTECVYDACDFMARRDRRRNVDVSPKISVHKLHVGAAHSGRLYLNENFIGLDVRYRHVFENESLAILM